MITHNHLKTTLEDYLVSHSKALLLRLANELRYSNLYIPSKNTDGKKAFDVYVRDGVTVTPLFTDLDEVEKFYKSRDVEVLSGSFELYRNVIKTSDIDGYIINPASENYLLLKDFILKITDIPKTTYISTNPYSPEELRAMCLNKDSALEDFLAKGGNALNHEALFEAMSTSPILVMMLSDTDLTPYFKEGILNMQLTGPVASMHVDEVGGKYASIFSSTERMGSVDTPKYKYAQVVNLSMLVNYVLSQDMDGIILNPSSDDVLISRGKLLNYSLGFERYADDERLSDSMYYIFTL